MSRKIIYEELIRDLSDRGMPSSMLSRVEKLYQPNGIYLKQRDKIKELEQRLKEAEAELEKEKAVVDKVATGEHGKSHYIIIAKQRQKERGE